MSWEREWDGLMISSARVFFIMISLYESTRVAFMSEDIICVRIRAFLLPFLYLILNFKMSRIPLNT